MLRRIYQKVLPSSVRKRLTPALHPIVTALNWHARRRGDGSVQFGPFKGMRLVDPASPLLFLLGTYELELHPIFARLRDRGFTRVLDIGASGGYYAVGTALWPTTVDVVCWEGQNRYHPEISALARANGAEDRVHVRGFCDNAELIAAIKDPGSTLIIMDVDGYEISLLGADEVPALRGTTILVEFHPDVLLDCGTALEERFAETHNSTRYLPRHRSADDYPIDSVRNNAFLRPAAARAILDRPMWLEGLHGWLLFEPKEAEDRTPG